MTDSRNLLCNEAPLAVLVDFEQIQIIQMRVEQKVIYCQQSTLYRQKVSSQ